jgi:hypothetical protein
MFLLILGESCMGSPDFFDEQVYYDCVHADHAGRFDDPTKIARWSNEFGGTDPRPDARCFDRLWDTRKTG